MLRYVFSGTIVVGVFVGLMLASYQWDNIFLSGRAVLLLAGRQGAEPKPSAELPVIQVPATPPLPTAEMPASPEEAIPQPASALPLPAGVPTRSADQAWSGSPSAGPAPAPAPPPLAANLPAAIPEVAPPPAAAAAPLSDAKQASSPPQAPRSEPSVAGPLPVPTPSSAAATAPPHMPVAEWPHISLPADRHDIARSTAPARQPSVAPPRRSTPPEPAWAAPPSRPQSSSIAQQTRRESPYRAELQTAAHPAVVVPRVTPAPPAPLVMSPVARLVSARNQIISGNLDGARLELERAETQLAFGAGADAGALAEITDSLGALAHGDRGEALRHIDRAASRH